ncbi:hypothetical protein K438DRAFT_1748364 [Mycena galopus ATCC 62051]|nr:hypothetical protein K438DRAFT_1748364 [Mycena galopus ATCC 62051]
MAALSSRVHPTYDMPSTGTGSEPDDLAADMDDGSQDDDSDGGIANDLALDTGDGSNGGIAADNSEHPSLRLDDDEESGPPRKRQKLDDNGFELLAESDGLTVRQYISLSYVF